jgi:hypothetical protein
LTAVGDGVGCKLEDAEVVAVLSVPIIEAFADGTLEYCQLLLLDHY